MSIKVSNEGGEAGKVMFLQVCVILSTGEGVPSLEGMSTNVCIFFNHALLHFDSLCSAEVIFVETWNYCIKMLKSYI